MMKISTSILGLLFPLVCICQDKASIGVPVLQLNASPYENGFLQGSTFKTQIYELHALWKENLEATYGYAADEIISRFLESTDFIPAIQKWTPDLLEEIRGISDGSGIDFNTTLAFQLVDEMWTSDELIREPHHCSSLGFNNYIIDGSENYIAQNIDVPAFYHGYEVILDILDTITDTRMLVNTFSGFIGANGMNNDIGVCVNSLLDLKSSKKGLPVCCVVRGILDQGSFAEAKAFIYSIEHASGQNYIIASRKEVVSFECASDLVVEFWPDSSRSYTYHTNTAYANNSFKAAYTSRMKDQFQPEPENIHPGCPRFEFIADELREAHSFDYDIIEKILLQPPVYNNYTWLSTIMEFNDSCNVMFISPGEKVDYILFDICN
jgi:hypothetical protein